jgi:hypothetical protein
MVKNTFWQWCDPDLHGSNSFWEAGSGSASEKLDPNLDEHQIQKPDPHQSQRSVDVEAKNGSTEGP